MTRGKNADGREVVPPSVYDEAPSFRSISDTLELIRGRRWLFEEMRRNR